MAATQSLRISQTASRSLSAVPPSRLLQHKCACGSAAGPTGHCQGCARRRLVQRPSLSRMGPGAKVTPEADPAFAPPSVERVLRSPGHPRDINSRSFMEHRFGHDFSRIGVYPDSAAANSARELGARGYTVENHIPFGDHACRPGSRDSQRLVAYELAHVVPEEAADNAFRPIPESLLVLRSTDSSGDVGHDFAKVRLHAETLPRRRLRPAAAAFRCSADETCADDEAVNYSGHGVAWCNDSGEMNVKFVENCAGNCIATHEATHVADQRDCCHKFKTCLDGAGDDWGQRAKCRSQWENYHDNLSDWTECNAYNMEAQCLNFFINNHCVSSGGDVSEACCATLQTELKTASDRMSSHCRNAVIWPCPW
jgi:hypothetical protein